MMLSVWWVVVAFLAGGCAGMMALALVAMASREQEQAVGAGEALTGEGLGSVKLEPTWTAK